MSWGTELWDKFQELGDHTQKGIDFCEKLAHFVRDRAKVEQEYAASLRRLTKNYQPKKKEEEEYGFTGHQGFVNMLKEMGDIAGQHEGITEGLVDAVYKEIKRIGTIAAAERRKQLEEGRKLMAQLENQKAQLARSKKKYEQAFKEQEKAERAFAEADANINLSRADVEKARANSHQKSQLCSQSKNDYAATLEHTNQFQRQHFFQTFPKVLQSLQEADEARSNGLKKCLLECVEIDKNIVPIINTCLANSQKCCNDIDPGEDSKRVIEKHKTGFEPPADIAFEDLDNPQSRAKGAAQGTPKNRSAANKTVKESKKDRPKMLKAKNAEPKEDFSHLPPNQQKKQLAKKISEIKSRIAKETKERQGMIKLQGVYTDNSKLGDPRTMEPKLRENEQLLTWLNAELQKFEDYLRGSSSNGSAGGGNVSKAGSFTSLNSSNAGDVAGAPASSSAPPAHAPPSDDAEGDFAHEQQQHPHPDASSEQPQQQEQQQTQQQTQPEPEPEKSAFSTEGDEFDEFQVIGTARALYSFEANNEGSISMEVDQSYPIIEADQGDGWTRIRKTNGEEGFVPTSYIEATY